MDAKPTEMGIFHIFKSDQMCKISTSFMIIWIGNTYVAVAEINAFVHSWFMQYVV